MSKPDLILPPPPRLLRYEDVIYDFNAAMRSRVKKDRPRTWAQFWRVWSDEQLNQRHNQVRLIPQRFSLTNRGE